MKSVEHDFCSHSRSSEYLEEKRMVSPPIDDVGFAHSVIERMEAALDLRHHPSFDGFH